MPKKIFLISASAGAGHVKAAEALDRAFRLEHPDVEVRHLDALAYSTALFRWLYSDGYIFAVHHLPQLFGWFFRITDKPWSNEAGRMVMDWTQNQRLVRLIEEEQPDWVISTHFLPPELVSRMKAQGRFRGRQAVVVTDFDVHAYWLCRHYDHYFVAKEESRCFLERVGIEPGKISVIGIPVSPVFAEAKDRAVMQEKQGFSSQLPTILVSTGASAIGPVGELVQELLSLRNPAQLVVICGRNRQLQQSLEQVGAGLSPAHPVKLKVVGFTTEMDEFMAGSDIFFGKPGGLSTCEALAKGLAMVIFKPIPGQEDRNADHLLESGVAIRCNALETVAYKIDQLLADPARLAGMQAQARLLGRPQAAREIVEKVLAL